MPMTEGQNFPISTNTWIELRTIFDAGAGRRWCSTRSLLVCWAADARGVMSGAWFIARANRLTILLCLMGGAALLCLMLPRDQEWLDAIRQGTPAAAREQVGALAWLLSYWGDFAGFNTLVFVTLGCFAFVRRSPFFRRITIAAVLGTLLSGGLANVGRVTTGRSRPNSRLTPGFYGPSLSAKKQSFPSAHTATAFGASIPVMVAFPPAGVPMMLISGAVAWSRMENNCHHPGDVMASIILATLFGVPLGLSIRRQQRAARFIS